MNWFDLILESQAEFYAHFIPHIVNVFRFLGPSEAMIMGDRPKHCDYNKNHDYHTADSNNL